MHEFVLADRVLQSVLEYMNDKRLTEVHEVGVDIGELLGVENESLRSAFTLLSKGTRVEGCKLRIRRVNGFVGCGKCGYEGGLRGDEVGHFVDPVFACPKCGLPVEIRAGRELKIISVA